jgi:predicted transcriptional regulator
MDDLVEQPTRRRIIDYVAANPGSSGREVQRQLDLGWGETAYHLGRLVRGEALRKESTGHRDYYFPLVLTLADRKIFQALHSPTERALLVALLDRPDLSSPDLLEALQVGRSAMYFHLRHLLNEGLVEESYSAGARRYRAARTDRLQELLGVYRETWEGRLVDRFAASFAGMLPDARPPGSPPPSDEGRGGT